MEVVNMEQVFTFSDFTATKEEVKTSLNDINNNFPISEKCGTNSATEAFGVFQVSTDVFLSSSSNIQTR